MRRGPPNYDQDRRRRYLLAALIPLLLLLLLFWVQWFTSGDDSEPEAVQPLPEQLLVSAPAQDGDATVRVPDVRGQPRDDAEDILGDIGLVPDVKGVPTANPDLDDIVIVTDPPGGDGVPPGTTVVVTVGEFIPPTATVLGDTTVRVPDVVGEEVDDAEDILTDADLVPQGRPVPTADPDLDGIVIDTNPDGGTVVPEGSTITFTFGDYQPTTATVRTGDPPDGTATTQPPGGNNPGGNNPGGNPTPTTQPPGNQPPGDNQPPDNRVAVPDLIGMTKEEAEQTLINLRLLPEALGRLLALQNSHNIVDTQEDPPGTLVDLGTTIAFTYGIWEGSRPTGPDTVTVPDLDGMTQAEAEQAVLDAGLLPQGTGHHVTIEALGDRVTSQDPAAGTQVARNSTVAFTYGIHTDNPPPPTTQPPGNNPPGNNPPGNNPPGNNPPGDTPPGDDLVAVPNLIGMTKDAAEQTVLAVGLLPESLGRLLEAQSLDGIVDTQEDPPGTLLPRGTTLAFTYGVHKGSRPTGPDTVAVPDLVGLTQAAAEQAVLDAGLLPQATGHAVTDQAQHDKVDTQNPAAGTQVARDSTVVFTYGIHTPVVGGGPGDDTQPPPGTTTTTTVPKATVPDLIGSAKATADAAVLAAGLVPSGTTVAVTDPAQDGKVQTQNPAAGTEVDRGSTVAFTYGEYTAPTPPPNKVQVPDVIGLQQGAAVTAITDVGLTHTAFATSTTNQSLNGQVWSQNPAAGTEVDPGSNVTFQYYEYRAPPPTQVAVPDIVGEDKADAEAAVTTAGLVPSGSSVDVTDPAEDGKVQTQSPAAGTQVNTGSTVTFTYGEYTAPTPPPTQVAVPDIVGEDKADAEAAVTTAGLVPSGSSVDVTDPAQDGKVQTQNPAADTQVNTGTTVTFTYGKYTAPTPPPTQVAVPDIVGSVKATGEGALTAVGLVPSGTGVVVDDAAQNGLVQTQSPAAGTQVASGSTVTFTYGVYTPSEIPPTPTVPTPTVPTPTVPTPTQVAVPDIVGEARTDAETAVTDAGLVPSGTAVAVTDSAQNGKVQTQSPAAGTQVNTGSTVTFTYAVYTPDGNVEVPRLTGLPKPRAEAALRNVGLVPSGTGVEEMDLKLDGIVLNENPVEGTFVAVGTTVTFTYGVPPPGPYLTTWKTLEEGEGMTVMWHIPLAEAQAHQLWYRAVGESTWTPHDITASGALRVDDEHEGPSDVIYTRIYGLYSDTEYELQYCVDAAACAANTLLTAPVTLTTAVLPNGPASIQSISPSGLSVAENVDPGNNIDNLAGWVYAHVGIGDANRKTPNEMRFWLEGTGSGKFTIEPWRPAPDGDTADALVRSAVELDYEQASSYTLTVHVSDGRSATSAKDLSSDDSLEVTITVTDVLERPDSPLLVLDSAAQTSISLSWAVPDPGDQTISGYRIQYRRQGDTRWGQTPLVTGTSTTISSLTAGTAYEVRGFTVTTGRPSTWSDRETASVLTVTTATTTPTPPPATTVAPSKVEVPDVIGLAHGAAEQAVKAVGLTVTSFSTSTTDQRQNGKVWSQTPAAGTELNPGQNVTIQWYRYSAPTPPPATTAPPTTTQAPAKVSVPDLLGLTKTAAEQALTAVGLVADGAAGLTTTNASLGDQVHSQGPKRGTQVDEGSTVTFLYYVYTAPTQVAVPDVVGETKTAAETAITDAGLTAATAAATTSTDDQTKDGTVASQDPASGTMVDSGSTVTLTYYSYTAPAQVTVPDVLRGDKAAADAAITAAGLVPAGTALHTDDPSEDGEVFSQNPGGGASADRGSTVTFQYYSTSVTTTTEAPKVTVPNLSGKSKAEAETALTDLGLVPDPHRRTTAVSSLDDTVFSQLPVPDAEVNAGTTVTFEYYVYEAPSDKVTVPTVTGLYKAAAETAIRNAGLVPNGVAVNRNDSPHLDGWVWSQTPAAGRQANSGSTVNFQYYKYTGTSDAGSNAKHTAPPPRTPLPSEQPRTGTETKARISDRPRRTTRAETPRRHR